ncbi:ArsR/SmtB family transcription factor [Pseudarthrobacter cellobiosi]|uniref:ArsR/SmtB family transcription factor n=1 Tax=Pseudarthrobacter cellobiosi TaxID=2953654 RepID=UPI00208E0EF1|nr:MULTISPECIES: metalloregulator ArsR/SmtB family transcription factor [unclassified Pseudarthrobacter]MCO4254628.1 metalloregulator ArsR/SmtB family transcription factor [Pseudarthrobacter sp. HLT1-5]MCO4276693.1 metalloregulator ArsR/SmtB family transcription factor [Pseudarthrobacter sp. HLT3-5]
MVTDDVFAVIAEATRRDILVSLRAGDKAVGELVEELSASQPTISKHLKVLREAQLVSMRAQGQKRYYALNPKPLEGIVSWLETFDVGPAATVAKSPRAEAEAGTERAVGTPLPDNVAVAAVLDRPGAELSPAVVIPGGTVAPLSDDTVPQQIGRTVGRAATKAADLLANLPNLPKFGRKK